MNPGLRYMRSIFQPLVSAILISACSSNPPLHPQTAISSAVLTAAQDAFDVQHYTLEIEVRPEQKFISGRVQMLAIAEAELSEVELDLDPRFQILSASINDVSAEYVLADGKLRLSASTINPGESFTTTVSYQGRPYQAENPPWDGGFVWDRTEGGEHWIASAAQGRGCDLYWPCKDHISDKPDHGADMHITVPAGLVAVMNGVLVSEQSVADRTTYHWRTTQPISAFHLALNIGPFQKYELQHRGSIKGAPEIPVVFYHVTEDMEKVEGLIRDDFMHQLQFLEQRIGPYPWGSEKIGIVEIPYLGMEHQTMNGYGNGFQNSPYGFDWLILHEFIHEWFGNLLTQEASRDFWLHEGITSYIEHLYYRQTVGDAAYWSEMWRRYNQVQNCVPVVPEMDVSMDYFDSNDVYFKTNWMLGTLRWLMGDEAFWRTIRLAVYDTASPWNLSYPLTPVSRSTEDFIDIASEQHGSDLNWFFDVYLRSTELPKLKQERTSAGIRLSWENYQQLSLDIPVKIIEGDSSHLLMIPSDGRLFPIPAGARVQIDPENRIYRDFGYRQWCSDS